LPQSAMFAVGPTVTWSSAQGCSGSGMRSRTQPKTSKFLQTVFWCGTKRSCGIAKDRHFPDSRDKACKNPSRCSLLFGRRPASNTEVGKGLPWLEGRDSSAPLPHGLWWRVTHREDNPSQFDTCTRHLLVLDPLNWSRGASSPLPKIEWGSVNSTDST